MNYIDTAPFYGQGQSEKIIGKALQGVPREAYYLATKVGRYGLERSNMFDFSAQRVKDGFNDSLKYLGLNYVDIVQVDNSVLFTSTRSLLCFCICNISQIHDVEFAEDINTVVTETLPTVKEFIMQGRAKFVGITAYPIDAITEVIKRAPPNSFDVGTHTTNQYSH